MTTANHPNPNDVTITATLKDTPISLPAADGSGYSRKPAPADGLYFETADGHSFFITAIDLRNKLTELTRERRGSPPLESLP